LHHACHKPGNVILFKAVLWVGNADGGDVTHNNKYN
jgi:hypothetical protein